MRHYFIIIPNKVQCTLEDMRERVVIVLDTLDYTKELVDGEDMYSYILNRHNKGKFINILDFGDKVYSDNKYLSFDYKYGSVSFDYNTRGGDLDITHNSDEFKIRKFLGTNSLLVIREGYPAKVLERPRSLPMSMNPRCLDIKGNNLEFTLVDKAVVSLGEEGVSFNGDLNIVDLDDGLRNYLNTLEGFNLFEGNRMDLALALRELSNLVSIERETADMWINGVLNGVNLSKVSIDILKCLSDVANKCCSKEVQSKIAKGIFMRKG